MSNIKRRYHGRHANGKVYRANGSSSKKNSAVSSGMAAAMLPLIVIGGILANPIILIVVLGIIGIFVGGIWLFTTFNKKD